MNDDRDLTFEAIDQHIRSANLKTLEAATRGVAAADFTADPKAVLGRICELYQVVRPILQALLKFPIPESWKKVIRAFTQALDLLCSFSG